MGKKSKLIQAPPRISEHSQAQNVIRVNRVQPKAPKERPISHIRSSVLSWLTDAPSIEEGESNKPTKPVKKPAPPPPPPQSLVPSEPKNNLCIRICLITILVAMILLLIGSIIGIALALTLQTTTTAATKGPASGNTTI